MGQLLDVSIKALPFSLSDGFEVTVDEKSFRYEVRVDGIRLTAINSISCNVKIGKFKQARFLLWIVWKKVWSFSELFTPIIDWNGNVSKSHRNSLITKAINRSVLPTDLLLDQLLSPIESKLQTEYSRVMSLRKNQGVEPESGEKQDAADGQ